MVCFLQISKKRSIRDNLLRLLATTEDVEESFEASSQSNVTNNSDDSKGRWSTIVCIQAGRRYNYNMFQMGKF